jgi:uncharacterized protein YbaP (TraB family)
MARLGSLLLGSALLFSLQGCATAGADAASQRAARPAATSAATLERVETTGPALWKVADADTTIYMFGTVHILPKDKQWMTPAVQQALTGSQSMVTEILSSEMADPAMQQAMMSRGMLPAGQTLRSLLNAEQRATYEGALQKLGVPAAAFDQFKPWMAAMTLSILPLIKEGYNPEAGVEKVLETAAGSQIKREALETVEFQIGVFDGMPQEAQIAYLVETAEQAENIKPMLDKMVAAWVVGNKDELASLMNEGLSGNEALADRLLYARNRNWAQWIDQRLDQPGTVFVAVGAGHLAGQNSVQNYLLAQNIVAAR